MSNPDKTPEEIVAMQGQWNRTKAMYQLEIDAVQKDVDDKVAEYATMQANVLEWANTPVAERSELRRQIIVARMEVDQIKDELQMAWTNFLAVNPAAQGTVTQ